jgi:hypothetical protein
MSLLNIERAYIHVCKYTYVHMQIVLGVGWGGQGYVCASFENIPRGSRS